MSIRSWGSRGRWFDAPIAVVAICWIAIWRLWPSAPQPLVTGGVAPMRAPARFAGVADLRLDERPDLYVLPDMQVLDRMAQSEALGLELPPPVIGPVSSGGAPALLRAPPPSVSKPPPPLLPGMGQAVHLAPSRAASPLDGAALGGRMWVAWMSPELARAGLELPIAGLAALWDGSGAFESEFSVAPSGAAALAGPHVFLERHSGSPELGRRLLRHVQQAVGDSAVAHYGSVVISLTKAIGE